MLLNEELKLKNVTLRNRIVMPPMAREGSADGKVSQDLIEYYRLRAECTGLIIVEHAYVSIEGKSTPKQLSMADDSVIDGFRNLTGAIHKENCFERLGNYFYSCRMELETFNAAQDFD